MVRSGFWNSLNTDIRTYYNSDFSHLMSLLIRDGVYQNYGNALNVRQGNGLEVIVDQGEAWFYETWIRNDNDLALEIDDAPIIAGYKRIDAVVIKIDKSLSVRNADITVIKGTPGSNPSIPNLPDTDEIKCVLLATVLVATDTTQITNADITNYIGTSTTPYISGILATINADNLLQQWSSQFTQWMYSNNRQFDIWYSETTEQAIQDIEEFEDGQQEAFTLWFNDIIGHLSQDAATDLQNQINQITAFYVQDNVLYLPNTGTSVSDGVLTIGSLSN